MLTQMVEMNWFPRSQFFFLVFSDTQKSYDFFNGIQNILLIDR